MHVTLQSCGICDIAAVTSIAVILHRTWDCHILGLQNGHDVVTEILVGRFPSGPAKI